MQTCQGKVSVHLDADWNLCCSVPVQGPSGLPPLNCVIVYYRYECTVQHRDSLPHDTSLHARSTYQEQYAPVLESLSFVLYRSQQVKRHRFVALAQKAQVYDLMLRLVYFYVAQWPPSSLQVGYCLASLNSFSIL